MDKYILVKQYPNSPVLGTSVEFYSNWGMYGQIYRNNPGKQMTLYEKEMIENYPEFWGKIIENPKQPLFTTEDGVDIYEGNMYYYIYNYNVCTKIAQKGNYKNLADYYFFTKEAAEEYIVMNKPCLSVTDVLDCIKVDIPDSWKYEYISVKLLEKFRQLLKNKL